MPLSDKLKQPSYRPAQSRIGPHFRFTHRHSIERVYDSVKTNTAYVTEREKVDPGFEKTMSLFKAHSKHVPAAPTDRFLPTKIFPTLHEKTHFKSVDCTPLRRSSVAPSRT